MRLGLNFAALLLSVSTWGTSSARAGFLYASRNDDTVTRIDTRTGDETTFAGTGLNQPRGLAFDAAGNLYAANNGDNTIARFTPGGVGSPFEFGTGGEPLFLAFPATATAAVPEPSSLVLLGVGGLSLTLFAGARRRRERRRGDRNGIA